MKSHDSGAPTSTGSPTRTTGRRLSLTKSQRETSAGAELLSLCQTATSDGSLADEEVAELKGWLQANRSTDLPAVQFLTPIVERILADGQVTTEERRDLFIAIERILPTDVREMSRSARQEKEKLEADQVRAEASAEKQRQQAQEREEHARNRPPHHFDFMIAGAKYNGRPAVIERHVDDDDQVALERDRDNQHSRNAVRVLTMTGKEIGFVPEEEAIAMAPLLDAGHTYSAFVKKVLLGSSHKIPVIVAKVARHADGTVDHSEANRRTSKSRLAPQQNASSTSSWPYIAGRLTRRFWWVAAIIGLILIVREFAR